MQFDQVMHSLLIGGGLAAAGSALSTTAGAFIYDIKLTDVRNEFRRHPHARRFKQRPLVNVVISGSLEQIQATLKSVATNSYRTNRIIVLHPEAHTLQFKRELKTAFPKLHILFARNKQTAKRHIKEGYVLWLSEGSMLDKKTLINAMMYLASKPVTVLVLDKKPMKNWRVSTLLQQYHTSVNRSFLKTRGLWSSSTQDNTAGTVIPAALFKTAWQVSQSPRSPLRGYRRAYLADSSLLIDRTSFNWADLPIMLVMLLIYGYLSYVALILATPALLWALWGIYTAWIDLSVLLDDGLSWRRRTQLLVLSPIAFNGYFLHMAWSIVAQSLHVITAYPAQLGRFLYTSAEGQKAFNTK